MLLSLMSWPWSTKIGVDVEDVLDAIDEMEFSWALSRSWCWGTLYPSRPLLLHRYSQKYRIALFAANASEKQTVVCQNILLDKSKILKIYLTKGVLFWGILTNLGLGDTEKLPSRI